MILKNIKLKFLTVLVWSALILSSCVKVGPDYVRPKPDFKPGERYQHTSRDASQASLVSSAERLKKDKWWELFGDSLLNRTVEEALENNLDIQKAAAAVREVAAYFRQAKADSWPTLDLSAGKTGSERVLRGAGAFSREGFITLKSTEYNVDFPVSYEVDLWGRVARSRESALANLWQSEENRLIVAQSIVAETVKLYLTMESLERLIKIKQNNIKSYRDSLALVKGRYERGLSLLLEVSQTKLALSQTKSELPELRRQLGETQQNLAVLLGKYPQTAPPRPQPEDYYQRLAKTPAGLPSDLLKRRPDIRKAEAQLISFNAGVGFAKASRFPSFSLTGSFGYSSEKLDNLFDESKVWSVRAGISQAIFHGGKLIAVQKAAEAKYDQGVADYNKTVLLALKEVENALLNRKELLKKRELTLKFLNEARLTQKIAEDRYERGLVDYQTVLESMQSKFTAESALVAVDLNLLKNRVNLHKSLGGGWGSPVKAKKEKSD